VHTSLLFVSVGDGLIVVCIVVGGGITVVGGGGSLIVCVDVDGGKLIVVGPAAGPEQSSPSGQHPIIPLLARTQYVL
jgi:hypothetical protein